MPTSPKRVFVSYSHDSEAHGARVLTLARRLDEDGVDCVLDQHLHSPPQGWPLWMEREVEAADFVLVVCSARYRDLANGQPRAGEGAGRGARFESVLIRQELYDAWMWNEKFIPVLLSGSAPEHILKPLRGHTFYSLDQEEEYPRLLGRLRGQPPVSSGEPPSSTPPEPGGPESARRRLDAAYERLEALTSADEDTTAALETIVELKREIRHGPQLEREDLLAEGRFKLLEPLGKGGFATVWKAYDRKTRGLVAVKVLHGQHASDRSRRERFFRGAREMAGLHHPGIARVILEEGQEGTHAFFVMEYVPGGDFRQWVLAGSSTLEERLDVIVEVGKALEHAHRRGILHRDVKPANVLLDESGRPKLTDFDLVRASRTSGGTRTGHMLGTFLYAAPELLDNAKEAGVAADVYGLGMTAVFAAHGADLPSTVMRDAPGFVRGLVLGGACKRVLARAVEWEVADRWRGVGDFCRALEVARREDRREARQTPERPSALPHRGKVSSRPPSSRPAPGREVSRRRRRLWSQSAWLRLTTAALLAVAVVLWAQFLLPRFLVSEDEPNGSGDTVPVHLPEMVRLRGGSFDMGSEAGYPDETPVHPVTIPAFSISKTEITVEQYAACVDSGTCREPGTGASCNWGDSERAQHPVNCVSWNDARDYVQWLTIERGTGYRLPSEAEWEYAARGEGKSREYPWGDEVADCDRAVLWGCGTSGTLPVCSKTAGNTSQGLCDMAGNVWEWVEDDWHVHYNDAPSQGEAWTDSPRGSARVLRGGSWRIVPVPARVALRDWHEPSARIGSVGFRVARSLPSTL